MQHVYMRLSLGASVAFVALLLIFSSAIADEGKKDRAPGVWAVQSIGMTRAGDLVQHTEYKLTEKECRLMVPLQWIELEKLHGTFVVAGVDCRRVEMRRLKTD